MKYKYEALEWKKKFDTRNINVTLYVYVHQNTKMLKEQKIIAYIYFGYINIFEIIIIKYKWKYVEKCFKSIIIIHILNLHHNWNHI